MKHEACIACLPNNGRLNHVLEVEGWLMGLARLPIFVEVLKKRKADATVKVLAKRLKVHDKKGAEPTKVSGARESGGPKRPLSAGILPTKSVKLNKGTVPRAIASAAAARITP
jgi:hypothetical protein